MIVEHGKITMKKAVDTMQGLECAIVLFYDSDNNYFIDDMGEIVYDLFTYITPGDLEIFKSEYEDLFILKSNGVYVEMIYPEYMPY